MSAAPALRHRLPDRLDWYTLRGLLAPLAMCLAVLLVALLLARLLRLFELAAATGASTWLVLQMIGSRVPQSLGLAVPAAFFAAIFVSVARSGDDNELDAMLATGRSITRMAVPYFLVAVTLAGFNFYLYGYLQPLTRYGYNALVHEARQTGWDARMEPHDFVTVRHGYTLGADDVGADGRQLGGVFVQRGDERGEEIITAERGRLVTSADGASLQLELQNGLIVSQRADGTVRTVRFADGRINEDFTAVPPPYRQRGEEVRELTLPELRVSPAAGNGQEITPAERSGEWHGRLAWIVLPLLLPLLALPLGMAAKRGRRVPGTVFAALALLLLYESLLLGESMAENGRASPLVSVWVPMVVFGLLGAWLFRSSLQWPGDNPVMRAVSAIESLFEGVQRRRKAASK